MGGTISNICAAAAFLLVLSEKLTLPLSDLILVAVKITSLLIKSSPVSLTCQMHYSHFMGVYGKRELNIRHEKSDNAQTSLQPLVVWN